MNWEKHGKQNTDATVELVLQKAQEMNIKSILVASVTGKTAKMFINKGLNIICITHQVGYAKPGLDGMNAETREYLMSNDVKLLTTTHLFAGVDRALRFKFQGVYPGEIIASVLRMFGQGVKVGVEIAVMALDAGLIPYDEDVIAVAGTGSGADSAIIVRPAHSQNFFETIIKEILCMPKEK